MNVSDYNPLDNHKDISYDASNPDHVNSQNNKAISREARIQQAYKVLMSTCEGRELLGDLLNFTGCKMRGFEGKTNLQYFKNGANYVGDYLDLQLRTADPMMYNKILGENVVCQKLM